MKRRVLVVEDDLLIRTGLARLLDKRGHEAITAATVAEGMELLKADPTHVLLDINLPDGVGISILKHVRQAKLPIRVAVVSGSVSLKLIDEAKLLAADAFFTKPPDWNKVMEWVAA